MKIIIPMAGRGTRMRPHTLTIPKPLLPVGGKPIVQRLVEGLAATCREKITDIAYVTGRFGDDAEKHLLQVAENLEAKGHIFYQDEPLGSAHAIMCAADVLDGPVIVAFADTLFYADFEINGEDDAVIYVQQIPDPSAFGVVLTDENNRITGFVEKPKNFVSDLAIIGIYYFKDGKNLRAELQHLLDNDIKEGGEYGITSALKSMHQKGLRLTTGKVREWLDCGNKDATVYTNQRVLENHKNERLVDKTAVIENSVVIPPSFIGAHAVIKNSVIGPYASIGTKCDIGSCVVSNSIVQSNTVLYNYVIKDSMIGNNVELKATAANLSVGDYTKQL